MHRLAFRTAILIICLLPAVFAQNPAKWNLASAAGGRSLAAGEVFKATLKADIEPEWHLYALEQPPGGPIAMTIKVSEGKPFQIDGAVVSTKPTVGQDPLFPDAEGKPLETRYFSTSAEFSIPLKALNAANVDDVSLDVRFQLCNLEICLPPKTQRVSFTGVEDVKKAPAAANVSAAPATSTSQPLNGGVPFSRDIWSFILLAIGAGLLSLLTPCVFPMIPITVSYFTNHAGHSRKRSIKLAMVYSLGIIATFTILGMLLAVFVGAAGMQIFSANPWVNIAITAVFLFFAFNLFGAYEISIPSSILTKLDNLSRNKEGEGGGVAGALLMGLTFTVTSFTCTSPFIGSIMVSSAQGNWRLPLLGMLAFSIVFALPFFVLALIPQLVTQLPRAGGWMNSIKVSMGFLEVAAAMKFLSNVDLIWNWGIVTRSVVLSMWMSIGIILSVYLLGKFQLFHDSKPERIGAFRLTSAIVSLAISFYLLTGLLGAKLGTLESFLPPETANTSMRFLGKGADETAWIENDYAAALAVAKAENKRVFIDFTGYTCTNCRWMEANIFTNNGVDAELRKFVRARLYTDREGAVFERQQQMEQDLFGTVALPFYAVVDANGKIISSFPGLTRSKDEFIDFLQKSQHN